VKPRAAEWGALAFNVSIDATADGVATETLI